MKQRLPSTAVDKGLDFTGFIEANPTDQEGELQGLRHGEARRWVPTFWFWLMGG